MANVPVRHKSSCKMQNLGFHFNFFPHFFGEKGIPHPLRRYREDPKSLGVQEETNLKNPQNIHSADLLKFLFSVRRPTKWPRERFSSFTFLSLLHFSLTSLSLLSFASLPHFASFISLPSLSLLSHFPPSLLSFISLLL